MRKREWVRVCLLAAVAAGCNESTGPDGNGGPITPDRSEVAVLNSISGTLQQFNRIDGRLVPFGRDIQLGAGFNGETADFLQDLWVTTSESPGGSQVIFGSFSTGEQAIAMFPDSAAVDPAKPTVVADASGTLGALVPARARDGIYIAFPGSPTAQLLIDGVGTFPERAVPAGLYIVSMDGNLDDEGDGRPIGPSRVVLHEFVSGSYFDEVRLPEGIVGATEALALQENLLFLAGGSLDSVSAAPAGDGHLVEIDMASRDVQDVHVLGGNGVSMEPGRNGLIYVVRTKGPGAAETDILSFNFSTRHFDRGPDNPIQPLDRDGSNLSCRVATSFVDSQVLCATYETASQGRLVLLEATGEFIADIAVGAGATDILMR